jgi:hypothetical protein
MFKRNYQFYSLQPLSTVLQVREGDGDGGGAGDAGGAGAADLQAQIAAAVEAATKGLKAKNDELLGSLKTTKEKLKAFDGYDPEHLKTLKDRLDNDEDAQLLAKGEKQKVIEKYTERMRAQHSTELEAERLKTKAAEDLVSTFKNEVLDNKIRAVTNGLHKGAVEDALLHARQIFTLDAKGNAVKLGSDGSPELGKDGQTPFSPAEWIESQKEAKPHWFPTSTSGSGSGDSKPGSGQGKTIKRVDFDRLPASRQGEVARSGTRIVD